MKKLLVTGFLTSICMLVAFSAVLAASAAKAKELQREFLDRVETLQTDALLGAMHPALRKQIDRPLMDDLVAAINERLGAAIDITPGRIDVRKDSVGTTITSESKIRFQHGEVDAKFVTLDGQLIEFDFASPKLKSWFSQPSDTSLYERIGDHFLRRWLSEEPNAAWEMMHSELQKVVDRQQLSRMSKSVLDRFGKVKSIRCTGTRAGKASHAPNLFIDYVVETEEATLAGEIEIQFDGLKGHLLGFKI